MNVLFLSPTASLGGAERVLLSLLTVLRRHYPQLNLHVLTLGEGPLSRALAVQGIDHTGVPVPANLEQLGDSQCSLRPGRGRQAQLLGHTLLALPSLWQLLRRFRQAVVACRPTLIHSNGIKTHLLARLAGVDAIPLLWHVHDFYGARPLASRFLACASGRMRGAIAISRAVAEDFQHSVGNRPVTVIPNAIDVERFRPRLLDGGCLDRLARLPVPAPGTARVGLLATYARWKGHDVFLQAISTLLRTATRMPPARFYVIGGPIYHTAGSQFQEEELRAAVRELGLSPHVGFIGFQEKPEDIYPALDVVVHASTQPEPFGLTIAEAMACGRAVIVSRAGGAAELIEHGHDALGVPPGDAGALAAALRSLLCDAGQRRRLGTEARRTALARFDQNRLGTQLMALYQQALGRELPMALAMTGAPCGH
jgi:glycosyltransferase involved in cell wall biosynthesis